MINLTPAFKQKLFNDERNYLEYADITLENNTVLHLTNANFWQNGFSIEDSIGEDNTFSALGAAVVNSCTLVINNIYDDFTEYDFTNAKVVVSVGMELPNPQDPSTTWIERAWKGTFMVDEATYNGSIITLKCLDDMAQFDRPYSESTLAYPTTLAAIVRDACAECIGSADLLGTQRFPHYDYEISTKPEDENVTFREVLSWCAAIAGCFARFAYDETAHDSVLELKWFNTQVFEDRAEGTDGGEFDTNSTAHYTTGDTLDGGTFNPWNTGDVADAGNFTDERPFHHISSLYNHNIGIDDIVITGVSAMIKVEMEDDDTTKSELEKKLVGTEGYVIDIGQNEFITETNVNEILTWLGEQLIGLTFRKASVTHPSDPSIEAGDIAFVYDKKGNEYPILVTRTVFNGFGMQTTVCGAETPNRNSSTRYSEITKSYVELRKKVKKRAGDAYARAMEALQTSLNNASGLYVTEVTQTDGSKITFLHNKPNPTAAQGIFEFPSNSKIVIMVSSAGIVVTNEGDTGGQDIGDRNWYGLRVNGTLIATILNTIGVNADWIRTGTLDADLITSGKIQSANGNVYFDLDNDDLVCSKLRSPVNYATGNVFLSVGEFTTSSQRYGVAVLQNSNYSSTALKMYPPASNNEFPVIYSSKGMYLICGDNPHSLATTPFITIQDSGVTIGYGTNTGGKLSVNQYEANGGLNFSCINFSMTGTFTYKGQAVIPSDRNLKKNIKPITQKYIDAIGSVELQEYEYKDEDGIRFGAISQDVIESFEKEGLDWKESSIVKSSRLRPEDDEFCGLNYIEFLLVRIAYDEKVMQEQQDEINDLKSRIEKLEKLVDQLL